MRRIYAGCIAAGFFAVAALACQAAEPETGYRYFWKGEQKPAEFFQNHPAASGRWVFEKEDENHWIGDVHYFCDNVDGQIYYVATGIKVVKRGDRVDLSKFEGEVALLKPTLTAKLGEPTEETAAFELIGYLKSDDKKKDDHMLLSHKQYRFNPAQLKGELRRHPRAFTKMSIITGNYHVHTSFGPIEVTDTRAVSSDVLDAHHGKQVVVSGKWSATAKANPLEQRAVGDSGERDIFSVSKISEEKK